MLIKYNDSIVKVLINMIPNKDITTEKFSGVLSVTHLNGKFINGYRIKNGRFISQFIKREKQYTPSILYRSDPEVANDCDESLDPDSIFCDNMLDEVVLGASSNTSKPPSLSIWMPTSNPVYYSPDSTASNGGGPSDSGSPDGDEGKEIFPCDDPIHGCAREEPTPCEMAFLARDVANIDNGNQASGTEPIASVLSGGWELNTTLDLSDIILTDNDSGFNSAVYQILVNGQYQYMYITQGSEPKDFQDWANNFDQLFGDSDQYEISVSNAEVLNGLVGSRELYFIGHSLGGGLASANALATGRPAYTYNAAGLSSPTKGKYDAGFNPYINATVVRGELLDGLQRKIGLMAESSGGINYIDYESEAWVELLTRVSPVADGYYQARLHLIESILKALGCEE